MSSLHTRGARLAAGLAIAAGLTVARATETENHTLAVLPTPGAMTVDGKINDWDLSGGVFACGELEHLRDQFAVWFHAMYDADNIYLLARWQDPTPMNNPETLGGHGFNGDCLQVRFILFPDTPEQTVTWWTMWRDAKGVAVADRSWPGPRNGVPDNPLENLARTDAQGVKQAFLTAADGKGYAQELSIPWKLLSVAGKAPAAGARFRLTIEPNFTAGAYGRITIKDIFDSSIKTPDRVFTFRAYKHWGWATLATVVKQTPQPVRLADSRTFPVTLQDGLPVVDWTGLIRKFEWVGFKPIAFEMPFDGYVSLNILAADGTVARHLLNWDPRTKGQQTVQWDGLTDAVYRTPGVPVPAGDYTWQLLVHPGAKLTFRGYACYGGRVPWHSSPLDAWLGDHGVPTAAVTDGERVYLACNGAEGGRHLLATDFEGHLLWGLQNTTGAGDPEFIAVDQGVAFVLHPKVPWMKGGPLLSRVEAKTGAYIPWPGRKDHLLPAADIWPEGQSGADHFTGLDARDGKLYATAGDVAFFTEDVVDWKAMMTSLKADTPLARRIMAAVNPETTKRLDAFLAGKIEQEKAFFTGNGRPRFDNEVADALNEQLRATDLTPEAAALTGPARAAANRRFLEQALAPGLRPGLPNAFLVLDAGTGKVQKSWPLPFGGALKAASPSLVYVISGGTSVVSINPQDGKLTTVVKDLTKAQGLTVDAAGNLYVSVGEPDMQVLVFDGQGRELRRLGRKGGRAPLGPWQQDGMLYPAGLAVTPDGHLWVCERDPHPKRVSTWNLADGRCLRELFGPTQYGASGAAINPQDPNLMIGVGCEWRMDPKTGTSVCVGTFDRQYHSFATYRTGRNGKLYLYTIHGKYGIGGIQVWERLGDANYARRAELHTAGDLGKAPGAQTTLWIDANGDGKEQPAEVQTRDGALLCAGSNGWSLNLGPDLTLYAQDMTDGTLKALPADGFNACGAPLYDLGKLRPMPAAMSAGYERNSGCALPSADNRAILVNLRVKDHPARFLWHGFDLPSGKLLWTYPNPFFQVHGSHAAPAPDPGLFRGAYGPIGAVAAAGAGQFWVINGNLGEWNALTSDGFFLTRLFNGNVFDWHWPHEATPGVDLTNLPPGSGGEDFGGSVTQGADGAIYVQSGKSAIWNLALTGLEKTVRPPGGKLTLSEADTRQALALREQALQSSAAGRELIVKRATIAFTGNLSADFKAGSLVDFQKSEDAKVRCAVAHDDTTLYLGWEVRDPTPWINGAEDISQMYAYGDTVDFQLATDPTANPKRSQAAKGDLRVSIGNFKGTPTAVLYRFINAEKKPRTFSSGVVQGWQVDWVDVLATATLKVKPGKDQYTVEAAMPLAALGLTLTPKLALRGDLGVTHSDPAGARTRLRTYWANQQTGLVDDVVFELQPAPQNWGTLTFE